VCQLRGGRRGQTSQEVAWAVELSDIGDLYISVPYVHRYCLHQQAQWSPSAAGARRSGGDFVRDRRRPTVASLVRDRLTLLTAHGISHLLGHDHKADHDAKRMARVERRLLDVGRSIR